jgi:hypothetical protein
MRSNQNSYKNGPKGLAGLWHSQRSPVLLLTLLILISAPSSYAAEAGRGDVEISIRYFDKRVYYVEDAPIFVQVTIANRGTGAYRFKLADERAFSVDFDVRTVSNRALEPAPVLVRRRSGSQQVFFREIAVEAGESFSFVEDIRNYANLSQSGAFVVQARVYPSLYRGLAEGEGSLESNRLSLNLRPPPLPGPGGIPLEMDVETNAILVREKLPPDEVVRYTLTARQKSQWERFFLYLDLDAMVSRDGVRQRQWIAESEEGRRRMVARYRSELQNAVVDGDIVTIPMEFEILQTNYGAEEGTVVVQEKFKTGDYIERKRYTYYLHRRDDTWTIADYTVLNLGTE